MRTVHIGLVCVALVATSCDDNKAKPAQAPQSVAAVKQFRTDAKLVFIYADVVGRFQSTPDAKTIPVASKKVVRVIETTVRKRSRGDHRYVHIVDLTETPTNDTYIGRPVTRLAFEQRALAALPAGKGSAFKLGPGTNHGKALAPHDQVIIYGTTWCGACSAAKRWLRGRNETFIEKDVEKDPAAKAELRAKAAAAGISPNRVPIIDVRGRLVVGFDRARLETLLKKNT